MKMRLKTKTTSGGGIDEWQAILRAAPSLVERMSENAADEALDLVEEGFAKQQNPYGEKWKEKAAPDGRSILVGKTTRLRRGWKKFRSAKGTWYIAPSVEYAAAHQDPKPRGAWGGKKLPQRMMIPSKSRGLPPEWRKRIEDSMGDVLSAHFSPGSKGRVNIGFLAYKIIGLKRRFSLQAIIRRAVREATDG